MFVYILFLVVVLILVVTLILVEIYSEISMKKFNAQIRKDIAERDAKERAEYLALKQKYNRS